MIPAVSEFDCGSLGWPVTEAGSGVCGTANLEKGCAGSATWSGAVDACAAAGARLCTREELESAAPDTTQCDVAVARVWTSVACSDGGRLTQAGSPANASAVPLQCTPETGVAAVICCADEAPSDVKGSCQVSGVDVSGCPADPCFVAWCSPGTGCEQTYLCGEGPCSLVDESCHDCSDQLVDFQDLTDPDTNIHDQSCNWIGGSPLIFDQLKISSSAGSVIFGCFDKNEDKIYLGIKDNDAGTLSIDFPGPVSSVTFNAREYLNHQTANDNFGTYEVVGSVGPVTFSVPTTPKQYVAVTAEFAEPTTTVQINVTTGVGYASWWGIDDIQYTTAPCE